MRPRAVWLIAMSSTSGGCGAARGAAMASGLLPRSGDAIPGGAMIGWAFVRTIPISPVRASRSAYRPAIPKWWLSRTPTTAMPCSPASSAATSHASIVGA